MHLFFDLDNTLLDDSKAKDYYLPKLYEEFLVFINRDFQTFSAVWIAAIEKFHKLYLEGKLTFSEQRLERFREAFNNSTMSSGVLANIDKTFVRLFQESWTLFDGWQEYLSKCKFNKSIITNGNGVQQRLKLQVLGIDQFFQSVFVSDEVSFSKPDRCFFNVALSGVNERADQCIMIGDSWEFDVVGARNSGIRPFWINHLGIRRHNDFADCEEFDSIASLIARLNEIEREENLTLPSR